MSSAARESLLPYFRRMTDPGGAAGVSDAELLQRFVSRGDEAAFELLVWRHGKMV